MYITPIGDLLGKADLRYQLYRNDRDLYANKRINQEKTAMEDLKMRVHKVFEACTALKLKLKQDKTELFLFSTRKKR